MTGGSGAGGQMNKTCCGVVYDCSFFYLMQVCNEENSFPLPLNPNLEKDNLHALLLLTLTGHNCDKSSGPGEGWVKSLFYKVQMKCDRIIRSMYNTQSLQVTMS